jgi:hypothetical protein
MMTVFPVRSPYEYDMMFDYFSAERASDFKIGIETCKTPEIDAMLTD